MAIKTQVVAKHLLASSANSTALPELANGHPQVFKENFDNNTGVRKGSWLAKYTVHTINLLQNS